MRKTFACGHIGKGSYCPRCSERARQMAVRVAVKFRERTAVDQSIGILNGID